MLFSLIAYVLSASLLISAAPSVSPGPDAVIHESMPRLPRGWQYHSDPYGGESIDFNLALTRQHEDILNTAQAVSDPENPRYGQHLAAYELENLRYQDDSMACHAITLWLASHGIGNVICEAGYAHFTTTAGIANQLLGTKFEYYQQHDLEPTLRTKQYSLPQHIADHVDYVYPTVHFLSAGKPQRHSLLESRQADFYSCIRNYCPQNISVVHNITYYPKDGKSGSKIGIAGFLDNFPNKTEVQYFLKEHGLKCQKTIPDFQVKCINNGPTSIPSNSSLLEEPNLDLIYSLAFTGPLPITFYSVGGRGPQLNQPGNVSVPARKSQNAPFVDFFEAILAEKYPPQVVFFSYSDDEQSVPIKYAQKLCDLMAQAAARGITIVGASGDGGAGGATYEEYACRGPNNEHRFIPTFPSSCPWMTSIGGLAAYPGPVSTSSGGFSNYFPVPDWQAKFTNQYIHEITGTDADRTGLYNASGRGIPDVSILGEGYLNFFGGSYFASAHGSTKGPAAVFASMIALLNDLRLRAGKPVLGYINPLLYSNKLAPAITDSVSEYYSSNGCSDGSFFSDGFRNFKGWDASTGLGSPDFTKLRKILT